MSEVLDQPMRPVRSMRRVPTAGAAAVQAALARVERALEELAETDPASLRAGETLEALRQVERVERRLAAGRLRLVREADLQGAAAEAGATSMAAWLRWAFRMHPGAAGGQVRLARVLAPGLAGGAGDGVASDGPAWALPGVMPEPDALVATGVALREARSPGRTPRSSRW